MIDAELFKNLEEFIMDRDSNRAFDHVGTQINPFLVALFDDIENNVLSVSFSRVNVGLEVDPREDLVIGRSWEAILRVIFKIELSGGTLSRNFAWGKVIKERLVTTFVVEGECDRNWMFILMEGRAISSLLVVELLLFKELDDHALGDQTDEATGSVNNRVTVVMGLKGLLACFHVRNGREGDDFRSHDLACPNILALSAGGSAKEGHLLHA